VAPRRIAAGAAVIIAALLIIFSVGSYNAPEAPAPPAALDQIAAKNRDAAAIAAASQRAESAAAANAADGLVEARQRNGQ
jgi:hypothetical protein